ncbi:MAG: NAD(P)/FAD-dependent oxidoreductase [Actinobacteria bacterium]|nr:NAD(P)/FAD-dependent oxidoreductase [Actinomycetota bacterium]
MHVHEVIVIGSGFSGQSAVIGLQKAGIEDWIVLERRSFLGGTWCQNTYPGAAVDVQSPLYSISSEPYPWSQMFAERDELERYTNYVIDKHHMRDRTELDADVCALDWDDEQQHWVIATRDGRTFRGQFVILGPGPLSNPKIPEFEGRDTFDGRSFHSNAWDHDYDLAGKRVAVIGSGASAAQIIPAIADQVGELHVFQRTPHWVLPRRDRKFSRLERALLENRYVYGALRSAIYLGLETRVIGFKYFPGLLDLVAKRQALAHITRQIPDPEIRRKVTPDYTIGCKRVIVSSTLYPALCRPNVTLHDAGDGIDEIVPAGIVTKHGDKVELDAIVYATGYDATDGATTFTVTGREGTPITDLWAEFPRAYLGTTMPRFPNMFLMLGPNTGIGHTSALFIMESQLRYALDCIQRTRNSHHRAIEPTAEAEDRYTEWVHRAMERTVWKSGGCSSWYQNSASGKVIAMYPGFSFSYRFRASRFRPQDHRLS